MSQLTDVELVRELGMTECAEGLIIHVGKDYCVKRHNLSGLRVHTIADGRLVKIADCIDTTVSNNALITVGGWIKLHETRLHELIGVRITTPEYHKRVANAWSAAGAEYLGAYISILLVPFFRTLSRVDLTHVRDMTDPEYLRQWSLMFRNLPGGLNLTVFTHKAAMMVGLRGLDPEHQTLILNAPIWKKAPNRGDAKEPIPLASKKDYKVQAPRVIAEADPQPQSHDIVLPAVLESDPEETQAEERPSLEVPDPLAAELALCPASVQVAYAVLGERLKAANAVNVATARAASLEKERLMTFVHPKRVHDGHAEAYLKGLEGEKRFAKRLSRVLGEHVVIRITRSQPKRLDMHVQLVDGYIAFEVKWHAINVSSRDISEFLDHVGILHRDGGGGSTGSLLGAVLVSLETNISGFGTQECRSVRCPKTGVKLWFLNRFEQQANPNAILSQVFEDIADQAWTFSQGYSQAMFHCENGEVVGTGAMKARYNSLRAIIPSLPLFVGTIRTERIAAATASAPVGCALSMVTDQHIVSESANSSGDLRTQAIIDRVSGDGLASIVNEKVGVQGSVAIRGSDGQIGVQLVDSEAGICGELHRDPATKALVGTFANSKGQSSEYAVVDGQLAECGDGIELARWVPREYCMFFDTTKPWRRASSALAKAIIAISVPDETSTISQADFVRRILEFSSTTDAVDVNVREEGPTNHKRIYYHLSQIVHPTHYSGGRGSNILGLKFRDPVLRGPELARRSHALMSS